MPGKLVGKYYYVWENKLTTYGFIFSPTALYFWSYLV